MTVLALLAIALVASPWCTGPAEWQSGAPADLTLKFSSSAGRQTATTVRIGMKSVDLETCVARLSAESGLRIIAEPDDPPRRRDVELSGDFQSVLTGICSQFGYVWERSRSGAILLRRLFKDPGDIPQIVPEELAATAQDILGAMDSLAFPRIPPAAPYVAEFAGSLSTDQLRALQSTGKLLASSLSPLQLKALAALIMNHRFADSYQVWRSVVALLRRPASSRLILSGPDHRAAPSGSGWIYALWQLRMPDSSYVGVALNPTVRR